MIYIVLKVLKFSNMFRSIFDYPQGDIFFFFTSVTKDKLIGFVVACLLYLLCFVLMLLRALPSLVVAVLCCCTYWVSSNRSELRCLYVLRIVNSWRRVKWTLETLVS